MKKVIFATGNEGKKKEIREILGDLDIQLLSQMCIRDRITPCCPKAYKAAAFHSSLVKMHPGPSLVMAFCPVCPGILEYTCLSASRDSDLKHVV